ncbi:MAG: alpha/beta hydrolase [Oscillospiraceae bacterium]
MKFKEYGNGDLPTIILLHGGGLSWWSIKNIADDLKDNYHIVIPIIDGHGEDGETTFVSIEDSADKLIQYIDQTQGGTVFAIGGLSIGAQIVVEILSKRETIAEFAIVESALLYPIKGTAALTVPMLKLFYGLINKKWFAKMQAKTLFVPKHMFKQYYQDSLKISKQSLINITLSNGDYNLNDSVGKTKAKVLIIVGSKELGIMKKSANRLHSIIENSELYIADKMGHGEISLLQHQKYLALIKNFFWD